MISVEANLRVTRSSKPYSSVQARHSIFLKGKAVLKNPMYMKRYFLFFPCEMFTLFTFICEESPNFLAWKPKQKDNTYCRSLVFLAHFSPISFTCKDISSFSCVCLNFWHPGEVFEVLTFTCEQRPNFICMKMKTKKQNVL